MPFPTTTDKPTGATLNPEERLRYARHLALPEFGEAGQLRLTQGSVLIVGAGGLGSPVALYLAAAGVGRMGLVDDDRVDFTNLQRQVLHATAAVGTMKVASAAERLRELNPAVKLETYPERLDAHNAQAIVRGYSVVVDGSDNLPTRYVLNDACVRERRPLVYGAVERFEGQVSVFEPPKGPCYRCLFPEPPPLDSVPSCAEAGILGVVTAVIGSLQANEAIKLLTGVGEPLHGRLLAFDAAQGSFRTLTLKRDRTCPVCGEASRIQRSTTEHVTNARSPERAQIRRLSPQDLQALEAAGKPVLFLDVEADRPADGVQSAAWATHAHIPLACLHERLDELAPWRERAVIATCQVGAQAIKAAELLIEGGFTNVAALPRA